MDKNEDYAVSPDELVWWMRESRETICAPYTDMIRERLYSEKNCLEFTELPLPVKIQEVEPAYTSKYDYFV